MAKKSAIEKNKRRQKLVAKYAAKREALKAVTTNQEASMEERFRAQLQLAELPAQLLQGSRPQPLRGDGSSARLLSQAEDEPYRASRPR